MLGIFKPQYWYLCAAYRPENIFFEIFEVFTLCISNRFEIFQLVPEKFHFLEKKNLRNRPDMPQKKLEIPKSGRFLRFFFLKN